MTTPTTPSQPMAPIVSPNELYIHTWDAVKKEIATSVQEARNAERNTLLLCGAIWAYLAGRSLPIPAVSTSTPPTPALEFLWYVPVILAAFGAMRVAALMISIRPRARYLREFEHIVLANQPMQGWEEYFRTHYRRGVGLTMWLFWFGLVVASAVVAMWRPW